MPQREYVPRHYKPILTNGHANGTKHVPTDLRLESVDGDGKFEFTFEALRPGLFRTTFGTSLSLSGPTVPGIRV